MYEPHAKASAQFVFEVETQLLCLKQPATLTEDELALVDQYALAELGSKPCAEHIIKIRNESAE